MTHCLDRGCLACDFFASSRVTPSTEFRESLLPLGCSQDQDRESDQLAAGLGGSERKKGDAATAFFLGPAR